MSSYLNNLLTNTTSRYNSLRRQLLSDEADGDTEDDSHISRVLRAYYTEKGRSFPQWLPPDPKAPQPVPAQFVSSSGRPGQPQMMAGGGGGRGNAGGLSDLWDAPQPQQQHVQEPVSLRRAHQGRGAAGGRQTRPGLSPEPQAQAQGRPLPSQRAGSYQSSLGDRASSNQSPPASSGSGTTAQERLKARLWGSGRSNSSGPSAASSASTSPAVGATRNPFERGGAPAGGGGRPPYPDERSGGGSGGRQQNAYGGGVSANAPWSGGGDPYADGGGGGGGGGGYNEPPRRPGGGGGGPGGGRMGLPSGPRMR
ncbi:Sec1-binding region of Mso1-domain-containing protein [Massariosphaeria phaeospora]|uniref:Sec1-binding region of Mso1-domain-containing protein n=1 Tax=Massariosphaeria phaeospora TaxID=100035 RepID=A0A7C8MKQ7_9PLEO|nr:Sec1-binding region of Mso1-domain-containing protein [Massariosphaeria phaeospora]